MGRKGKSKRRAEARNNLQKNQTKSTASQDIAANRNKTSSSTSTYTKHNYTKHNYKPSPPCHSGNPLVFETHGIKVYAGGANRAGGWKNERMIRDVVIGPKEVLYSLPTPLPGNWRVARWQPKMIPVPWPDFSAPSWGPVFWEDLWQDLLEQNVQDILVQCAGGHGRTGTMLAILAGKGQLKEWKTVQEIVSWVREEYCDHAVETDSQLKYISKTLGIPIGDDPSFVLDDRWGSYGSAYNDYGSKGEFTKYSDPWDEDEWWREVDEQVDSHFEDSTKKGYTGKMLTEYDEGGRDVVITYPDDPQYTEDGPTETDQDPITETSDQEYEWSPEDGPITDEMLEDVGALPPASRTFCPPCKKTRNMTKTYWGEEIGDRRTIEGQCSVCDHDLIKLEFYGDRR